jgi:hypothetical protein
MLVALLMFTIPFLGTSDRTSNNNAGSPITIQLIDESGNKKDFDKNFVLQNKVIDNLIEDLPGQSYYQIPERISMDQFSRFYADSLNGFKDTAEHAISLRTLADYFVYADKLENDVLKKNLENVIHAKISNPPSKITKEWKNDVAYAEEHLSHYLAIPKKNFLINLAIYKANEEMRQPNATHKKLNPNEFHQHLRESARKKNNWLQILLQQDPSTQIIFALPESANNDTSINDASIVEYTILKDPDIRLVWFNKNTNRQRTKNFTYLDERYWNINKKGFFNFSGFDWEKVYLMANTNNNNQLAFAIPGSIAITPKPLQNSPQSKVISLKTIQTKALPSHLAFSCDGRLLSCIINNEPYIINIATKKIIPTHLPDVFSSILISDSLLLIRTLSGTTYAYNIISKQLTPIPTSVIDYFTVCYQNENSVLVVGLKETTDGQGQTIIETISETIDLNNLS